MNGLRARPVARMVGLVALVVVVVATAIGVYSQTSAFSYPDLLSALRGQGASVQEAGIASAVLFSGTGHGLVVNGAQIAAYEYGTTLAAQLDASRVSADGSTTRGGFGPFGGRAVSVDWIASPHHFHKGRVIVTYIGADASALRLLTAILGPQFAGG